MYYAPRKSMDFIENEQYRLGGVAKMGNADFSSQWRIENPLFLHANCMQYVGNHQIGTIESNTPCGALRPGGG